MTDTTTPDTTSTLLNVDALKASLQLHEGCRLKVYVDTIGKFTIGYGRNLSDKGISQDEANQLLADDIQDVLAEAQCQTWWLYVKDSEPWARAMAELLFIMGSGGVAGFKNMLAALKASDGVGAANALLDSRFAQQTGQRAKDIAALFMG